MANIFARIFGNPKTVTNPFLDTCVHEYELLMTSSHIVDAGTGLGDELYAEECHIYCPKCRTRQKVSSKEWKILQKQQEADKRFAEKLDIYVKENL